MHPYLTSSITHPSAAADPQVLRCTTTADFLAALPLLTGFTDESSIFIVLFRDERSSDVLRLELPPHESQQVVTALIRGIIALIRETGSGAGAPAIVLTSRQRFEPGGLAPWARFALQLEQRCRYQGWKLRELAIIAADGWSSLLNEPAAVKRPLSEIHESAIAEDTKTFSSCTPSLHDFGALPPTETSRALAVARHLHRLSERRQADSIGPADTRATPNHQGKHLANAARTLESCLTAIARLEAASLTTAPGSLPVRVPPQFLAELIAVAQPTDCWLVLALTTLSCADNVANIAAQTEPKLLSDLPVNPASAQHTGEDAPSIHRLLSELSNDAPNLHRLRLMTRVCADAISHAPTPQQPALLALLAWTWWMRGLQSIAQRLTEQSLKIAPDHPLTLMVQRLCEVPPACHLHRIRAKLRTAA